MNKLLSLLMAIILMVMTPVTANASSRSIYSDLDWYYPCPDEYGVYFTYNPPDHYGLDISAPNDSDICSVDDGIVVFSGYHYSTGHYVVVSNDTKLSGVSNALYTRYLHMDNAPDVIIDESVSKGQRVGGVGKMGDYVSVRVDHLHFDVNTGKYTGGGNFSANNTIDPELFWPDISFDYLNSKAARSATPQTGQPINLDEYIDTQLIRYVGEDAFEQWITEDSGNITLQRFKERFNISASQFTQLVYQFGLQDVYAGLY